MEVVKQHLGGRREYYAVLGELYRAVLESPDFKGKISMLDLDDFFLDVRLHTRRRLIENVTKGDLERALRKHLFHKERWYDFYFGPLMTAGFPAGVEFGLGQLRPFAELPPDVRRFVSAHHYKAQNRPRKRSASAMETPRSEDWFLHLRVSTVGRMDAVEKAQLGKRRTLAAYELITGAGEFTRGLVYWAFPAMDDDQCYMMCDETGESKHFEVTDLPTFIARVPGVEEIADDMTRIVRKNNASELETRIVACADIFGMIEGSAPLNVRFLLKMIALESLFLSEDDRDNLGWKLAEKVTYLLGDSKYWMAFAFGLLPHMGFLGNVPEGMVTDDFVKENRSESRVRLNREVVRLYRKRSSFAHQQVRRRAEPINDYDYEMVSWLLRLSAIAMLALTKKGITHLRRTEPSDPSSFDGLIEKLKY
ncbi:MAG: hypothetical protein HY247_08395 [archaeon]|nr:MAG: hypothetical protein HY247_08395 [archaeon]